MMNLGRYLLAGRMGKMGTKKTKKHMAVRGGLGDVCGYAELHNLPETEWGTRLTTDPAEVTCGQCLRILRKPGVVVTPKVGITYIPS